MLTKIKRLAAVVVSGLALCATLAVAAEPAYAYGPCPPGTHWDDITSSCIRDR
jgi:hypothetical protein